MIQKLSTVLGFVLILASSGAGAKTGTVQRYLMNPQGNVDGLLLKDGTQVNFPPHMSKELTDIVSPKDKVEYSGVQESPKVFKARTIKSIKKTTTVMEVPAPLDTKEAPAMTEIKAQGKIEKQIFGPEGKVIGVVLSEGTIVHVSPELIESSKVKLSVGKKLNVTGNGTKNSFGQAVQASEVANK